MTNPVPQRSTRMEANTAHAVISPNDEFFHSRSSDPDWNESGWFSLHVPELSLSGFVYTHHRPNRSYVWAGFGLWDHTAFGQHDCLWHDYLPRPLSQSVQTTGAAVLGYSLDEGLSTETLAPLQHYRLRYRTDECRAQLEWRALRPPVVSGLAGGWDGFGHGHFEQIGKMAGWIEILGERIDIDCYSIRDRSWGPHKPIGLLRGGYPWGIASAEHAFQVQAVSDIAPQDDVVIGTTEQIKKGWYLREGRVEAVHSGERTVVRGVDGRPQEIHLSARDEIGRDLHAHGKCKNWLQFSFLGMYWWWCLTEWDLNGTHCWGEEIDFFGSSAYRRFARSLNATPHLQRHSGYR